MLNVYDAFAITSFAVLGIYVACKELVKFVMNFCNWYTEAKEAGLIEK